MFVNVSKSIRCSLTPNVATSFSALKRFQSSTVLPSFQHLKLEQRGTDDRVGVVTLARRGAMNALNSELMLELKDALSHYDKLEQVKCIVLTGSDRAFAVGADIKEMQPTNFAQNYKSNFLRQWSDISLIRTPIIAAVNGYALGGGCELAMMCDIIYAGDKAKFGQPEITLGTIPGAGGTQRLPRAIGKSKAMELNLTGLQMDAEEACQRGLVSKVVPAADLVDEAVKTADVIGKHSKLILQMVKDATNASYESSLSEGLLTEKRLFHASFSTHDRSEGMTAFLEKRKPDWKNE